MRRRLCWHRSEKELERLRFLFRILPREEDGDGERFLAARPLTRRPRRRARRLASREVPRGDRLAGGGAPLTAEPQVPREVSRGDRLAGGEERRRRFECSAGERTRPEAPLAEDDDEDLRLRPGGRGRE